MGYYTRFDLNIISGEPDPVEVARLDEDTHAGKTFGSYDLRLDSSDWDTMKWYSYHEDMKALSVEYPNVLFVLSGEGEESGDIWKSYYMNGEAQEVKAKIVFEEPDLSKFRRVDLTPKRKAELEEKRRALQAEQERIQRELDNLGPVE